MAAKLPYWIAYVNGFRMEERFSTEERSRRRLAELRSFRYVRIMDYYVGEEP